MSTFHFVIPTSLEDGSAAVYIGVVLLSRDISWVCEGFGRSLLPIQTLKSSRYYRAINEDHERDIFNIFLSAYPRLRRYLPSVQLSITHTHVLSGDDFYYRAVSNRMCAVDMPAVLSRFQASLTLEMLFEYLLHVGLLFKMSVHLVCRYSSWHTYQPNHSSWDGVLERTDVKDEVWSWFPANSEGFRDTRLSAPNFAKLNFQAHKRSSF